MPAPHFLEPLLAASAADRFGLSVADRGVRLATTVEAAFDSKTRNRGLLGRDALAAGTALIIAPSNSVHTFFMKFPIDLVYTARDGRIVKIRHAVPAWRLSMAPGAFAVIELAAGSVERAGARVGDRLVVEPL